MILLKAIVLYYCIQYDMPYYFVCNIITLESNWDVYARALNRQGYYDEGLMQLNTKYFKNNSIEQNIKTGIQYLRELYSKTGSLYDTACAYRMGLTGYRTKPTPVGVRRYAEKAVSGGKLWTLIYHGFSKLQSIRQDGIGAVICHR